jgi:hypothetical protein
MRITSASTIFGQTPNQTRHVFLQILRPDLEDPGITRDRLTVNCYKR